MSALPRAVAQIQSTAIWIVVTLAIYALARWGYARTRNPLLNPALVSIAAVIGLLSVTGTPYAEYDRGGHLLSFFLGPAIVALGVPLALQLGEIWRNVRAIAAATTAGSMIGILAGVGVAAALGAPHDVVRSLAPRSVTTPIAMAIALRIGGIPALSALVAISTGVIGGVIGPTLLRSIGVTSRLATGLSLGAAAHGLGTARATEEGDVEGAASGMAMGLNGIVTALLAPAVVAILAILFGSRF